MSTRKIVLLEVIRNFAYSEMADGSDFQSEFKDWLSYMLKDK